MRTMNSDVKTLVALASHLRCAVEAIGQLVDQRVVVRLESPDREVSVAVDAHGRLLRLQLAPGATSRMPCQVLGAVINETLAAAARAAAASAELAQVS
jgi:hypothetical protein